MAKRPGGEIRRCVVADDDAGSEPGWSYADAFELWLTGQDERTAEQWARDALEQSPRLIRSIILFAQRQLLRLDLGPRGSTPDHVLGWRIVESDQDTIRLSADGPLLRGVILGRRLASEGCEIRTYLYFHRRRAGVLWRLVGPIHRRVAPYLLRRAAAS